MECQYVTHDLADEFRAAGWDLKPLDSHHGRHALLATRDPIKAAIIKHAAASRRYASAEPGYKRGHERALRNAMTEWLKAEQNV